MKNLITKAAVAVSLAGLVSTTSFAANNAIALTAEIGVVTVVGFADVSAETLNDTFINDGTEDIDFGIAAAGDVLAAVTKPIFVRHNDTGTNAQIEITDANAGQLKNGANTLPCTYTLLGAAYVPSTTGVVELVTAGTTNAGSVTIGDFVATPGSTVALPTGIYTTTLTVTVSGV